MQPFDRPEQRRNVGVKSLVVELKIRLNVSHYKCSINAALMHETTHLVFAIGHMR